MAAMVHGKASPSKAAGASAVWELSRSSRALAPTVTPRRAAVSTKSSRVTLGVFETAEDEGGAGEPAGAEDGPGVASAAFGVVGEKGLQRVGELGYGSGQGRLRWSGGWCGNSPLTPEPSG